MSYALHLLSSFAILALSGLALNLAVGLAGRVVLCGGALVGVGAYGFAILSGRHGWDPVLTLSAVFGIGLIVGLAVAAATDRMSDEVVILATIAFQALFYEVAYNWTPVTGGSYGLVLKPTQVTGLSLGHPAGAAGMAGAVLLAAVAVNARLTASPFRTALVASRESLLAFRATGRRPLAVRGWAFALGGGALAIAGALYAVSTGYLDPASFSLEQSIFLLTVVILGGSGTRFGAILGAAVLTLLPELIRTLHLPASSIGPVRQALLGALIVAMVWFRRRALERLGKPKRRRLEQSRARRRGCGQVVRRRGGGRRRLLGNRRRQRL